VADRKKKRTSLLSPALASSRRALRAKIPRGAIAGGATRSRRLGAAFSTIVHTSPHEDIEIPDVTIWEVMERQAAEQPDKPAFVCGVTHEARTFSELHDGAKRMAVALARDGVRKGDAVVLHSFNCIDYPMVVLGTWLSRCLQVVQAGC
jgi:non-ribosomal peptide synthetase component F